MAREFNINEIEFSKPDDKTTSELLTGEYLTGLDKNSGLESNTEVEKNEYIKFPDQSVVQAAGNPHENGGIDVAIPDGTDVVSDHLKPTKKQIRDIEKTYDITVSPNDTYAKIIEKYTKKIGLQKLNEDQAKVFEVLEKETKNKDIPKATAGVNLEYLSGKIKQLEDKKNLLEPKRKEFFDYIFDLQESTKTSNDKTGEFKNGGTYIETLAKQYNIPVESVKNFLERGGTTLPIYEDGPIKFTYNYKTNKFQPEKEEYQKATQKGAYGTFQTETSVQEGLQQLYNNFPDYVAKNLGPYINIDDKGNVSFKGNLQLNKKQEVIGNLQKDMAKRYDENYAAILADPTATEEEKNIAKQWYENESFMHDKPLSNSVIPQSKIDELNKKGIKTYGQLEAKISSINDPLLSGLSKEQKNNLQPLLVRNYDLKAGQYTLGRQSVGVDLVTPEDLKKLQDKGIRTLKQISETDFNNLSDVSKQRVTEFKKRTADRPDADFFIDPIKVPGENPTTPEKPEDKITEPPKIEDPAKIGQGREVEDLIKKYITKKPNIPKYFFTPDQSPLPPTPAAPNLKNDITLGRIDPVRIGIETQLREVANQNQFVAQQLEGMPESQKASALALMMANSNDSINKAATAANQTNAQNIASSELFNLQQGDKENIMNANNNLSFEQRTFGAQAKAEEMLRRYYDRMNTINIDNLKNTQKLNMIDSMFPEYSLDFSGTRINFDPDNPGTPILKDNFFKTLGV